MTNCEDKMTSEIEMAAGLARIGKTEEQLEAERRAAELAKKQAEWAQLVAKANAADPRRCQGRVSGGTSFYVRGRACSNAAKYHREERVGTWEADSPMVTRHYCAQHDEISKNERQRARWEEENKVREAQWAREARMRDRSELVSKFVGNVTSEKLKELLDAGITLETLIR
jgi:hypothetical protein